MASPTPVTSVQTKKSGSELIEQILQDWLEYGYKDTGMTVFDRDNGHFMLLEVAWQGQKRIHHVLAQVDILEGEFWIQVDHTPTGIGIDLEKAGVPKNRIVLGFYPLEHRQYGEYAAQ